MHLFIYLFVYFPVGLVKNRMLSVCIGAPFRFDNQLFIAVLQPFLAPPVGQTIER